jgi:3-hydroxymyristoyl/3-hydroxydecanoyl-(acyl carrier protein) dehydratase
LLALFETWQISVEELPGGRYRVPITAELGYFRGHFTGQPILAGVVQIQRIALRQARVRWPDLTGVERVTRVKFKRLITPGEVLILSLTRKGDSQVSFQLATEAGEEAVSSGVLHFRKTAGDTREKPTDATQARIVHE